MFMWERKEIQALLREGILIESPMWHNPAVNRTCEKNRAGRLLPR